MKNCCAKFWCLSFAFLLTFLLVGCDVENVEYEDDDTYALFDRPGMAPTNAEIQEALAIIAAGGPVDDLPGAYAVLMDFLGVTVDPEDISQATFTVAEISDMINSVMGNFCGPNTEFIVPEILRAAIRESKRPRPDPFNPDAPQNSALLAVVESLKNSGISDAGDVGDDIELSHGDLLLLLISIHQSHDPDPLINRWAELIDPVLEDNSCGTVDLPPLEEFILNTTGISVSAPHQGEVTVG